MLSFGRRVVVFQREVLQTVFRVMAAGDLDLAIWLHTDVDPSDEEFDAAIAQISALKRKREADLSRFRTLIVSDGGAPSSAQRTRLFALFEESSKASLVTIALANPIKRSLATVLTWLNPAFRAFEPRSVAHALAYIDVLAHQSAILDELGAMQAELPSSRTLREIAKVLGQ